MATYYVRPDGNDSNTGLGPSTSLAWATVTKAIGATGVGVGDTVYFAPGTYRGSYTAAFTNPANSGQRISFIGDPTCTQFTGVNVGPVIWTNFTSNSVTPSGSTMLNMTKDFVTLQNICLQGIGLDGAPHFGRMMWFEGQGHVLTNCNVMQIPKTSAYGPLFYLTAGGQGPVFTNCQFWNAITILGKTTATAWNSNTSIKDCLFLKLNVNNEPVGLTIQSETSGSLGGVTIANCTILAANSAVIFTSCSTSFPSTITNSFICSGGTGISASANNGQVVQTYNAIIASSILSNVATSATTVTNPMSIIDSGYTRISGLNPLPTLALLTSTYGINAGINTYSPATDMYGVTWSTPTTPTIGSIESVTYSTAGNYFPTERNASTITIAPGSTSQSIELYLGVTGLTASTSGLSARYNRTRTASVSIPLVARTVAQAWTAGGFAEVDATNMPGIYRLDLPDAALAAGADDVTVVVRGASGTNGAVMTIKLSSGGLTSAQTASAVWDAVASSYNTAGSMGEAGQRLTGYSLASSQTFSTTGSVGSVTGAVTVGTNNDKTGYALSSAANTSAADAVWNSTRSTHTTAGTFGEYVNAELVTPVTSAALVRMGPYEVKADGLGASDPLDIQKGAQHGVDIQCVDGNGNGIDITSATVTAKVYNSGGSLVDTYSCTATYAADGRATFTIDTTVTDTPGTYTATITRTTGASDTQVFGPLRIYVRDI